MHKNVTFLSFYYEKYSYIDAKSQYIVAPEKTTNPLNSGLS